MMASFVAVDVAVTAVAWILAYLLRFHVGWVQTFIPVTKGIPELSRYLLLLPLIALLWPAVLYFHGLYQIKRGRSRIDLFFAILFSVLIGSALTLAATLYIRVYHRYQPEVAPLLGVQPGGLRHLRRDGRCLPQRRAMGHPGLAPASMGRRLQRHPGPGGRHRRPRADRGGGPRRPPGARLSGDRLPGRDGGGRRTRRPPGGRHPRPRPRGDRRSRARISSTSPFPCRITLASSRWSRG